MPVTGKQSTILWRNAISTLTWLSPHIPQQFAKYYNCLGLLFQSGAMEKKATEQHWLCAQGGRHDTPHVCRTGQIRFFSQSAMQNEQLFKKM